MKSNLKNTLFPAMLLGVLLLNFGCEKEELPEEEIYHLQVFAISPGSYISSYRWSEHQKGEIPHYFGGAKVYLYGKEEDYLLRANPLHEGETDENGFFYREFAEPDTFWIHVEKGPLSSNRQIKNKLACPGEDSHVVSTNEVPLNPKEWHNFLREGKEGNGSWFFATLTPNPTQLQLKVYHNGQPVKGAKTTLYFSEEAYLQDIPAWQELEELKSSYGIFPPELIEEYKRIIGFEDVCLLRTFMARTDAAGEVYFDNLEPRQYWFRIEKEGMSNEGGLIKLDEALPDNPDITTSITVGIQ
jgi:hypothetical protein